MKRYANRSWKSLLALALMLALCLALLPAGADTPNRNINLGEETWYMSMLAHEGRLLGLNTEGLFELSLDDGKPTLLSADIRGNYGPKGVIEGVDVLLAGGEQLYALNSGLGEFYSLTLQPEPKLSLLHTFTDLQDISLGDWFIQEGQLVGFNDYAGQLWQGDIASGKGQARPLAGINRLTAYKPGSYAGLRMVTQEGGRVWQLAAIDSQTLAISPLHDLPGETSPHALIYDAPADRLIMAGRSTIDLWQQDQGLREAAFYAPGDAGQLLVLGPDLVSLTVDGLLVIRSLKEDAMAGRMTLSVMDPIGRGNDYLGFIEQHPQIELKFVGVMEEDEAEAHFIQHMLTRDDTVDVYLLRDQNLLDVLKRKGYALDMAQNPDLASRAARLLPALRQALGDEQRLLAFPKEFYLTMLSYHVDSFKTLGLSLPTTYMEYYQFCHDWLSTKAQQHEDYRLMPFENGMDILSLLRRYADEQSAQGKPLRFNTPEMTELLTLYHQLTKLEPALPEGQAQWLFYSYDIPAKGEYDYLPLTFDKAAPFTLGFAPGSFKYYVVNPYTKSPEQALLLIEGFAKGLHSRQELILYTDKDLPVPNPNYEAHLKQRLEGLARYEKMLAEAGELERRQLEDQVKLMREDIELDRERSRWEISQAEVDSWLKYAGKVYLNPFNPIPQLMAQYPGFFDSIHSNPNFDVAQFLSQLDDMVDKATKE